MERSGSIYEKRIVEGVSFEIQFLNFRDVYLEILSRRNDGHLRAFKDAKVLYSSDPSVPFMVEMATTLFRMGLPDLSSKNIVLIRKHLHHVLEDGDELLQAGKISSLLYNDNLLFCELISNWFRLHNIFRAKREYTLKELGEKNPALGSLTTRYLKCWNPAEKHEILRELLFCVLEPFGGALEQTWSLSGEPNK
ncbi:MAG: hypothetical protein JKX97_04525 [Candidatus Lindowbacteria bacterium]|nr:hypothetical protein [Candidatus Lindowbacteria bacterium]